MTEPPRSGDVTPRLFVVATSHLDSQWRWTIRDTIRRFLPRTLRENFALFEVFPNYVLSFEGAFRYMLVEEYYPQGFETLETWVSKGRWRLAGSMIDAPDVNLAAPESLIRHILYATRYFLSRFGVSSRDVFLPDCFGFPYSLPTVAAHCGLLGFSSSKLVKWMAPAEIPFDFGVWEGPDGSRLPAALRPGGYGERLSEDLSRSRAWQRRLEHQARTSGVAIGYKYFGVGDRGGSPDEASLYWLERSVRSQESISVIHSGSDEVFRRLTDEELEQLPRHRGELLLPTHGTGCWTSQAVLKRWNRQNEQLADSAERAATIASWLAQFPYPSEQLRGDWIRFLWHQMHDDLTGTSIPQAYEVTWNDEVLSLNRFATVLTDALGAIARGLDTEVEGVPVVVFNPLSAARRDVVEAVIDFADETPTAVRVIDPGGREVPAQLSRVTAEGATVVFVASVPALSVGVFDVRPRRDEPAPSDDLSVTETLLENERLRIEIGASGDVDEIYDRVNRLQVLSAPARLELLPDRSRRWPAWEIQYRDLCAAPTPVDGTPVVRVVERGPARVAVAIERRMLGSRMRQTVRLARDLDRLEVVNDVEWATRGRLLKARFPLACRNPTATYDLGCGVVERGNNAPEKHEVPAQQWADLTDTSGAHGVSILSDCRYGWDKPDDRTLRLSLLRSPAALRRFPHQAGQDFGVHRFGYGIYPHAGSWSSAGTSIQAARFNRPLLAFKATRHRGPLGRELRFLESDQEAVQVRALKRTEDGGEWTLRLQETTGSRARATLCLGEGIGSAREVDGCESEIGPAQVEDGCLHVHVRSFQPRTFALRLGPSSVRIPPLPTQRLDLPRDLEVATFHGDKHRVDFDGRGHSFAGELLPRELMSGEVPFRLGRCEPRSPHALACRGQSLELGSGGFDTLYLLAAAADDTDVEVVFDVDAAPQPLRINSWSRPVGRWWYRKLVLGRPWGRPHEGHIVRTPVAWVGTHRHNRRLRDEPYAFSYLFRYELALRARGSQLTLPDEPRVAIFAATLANAAGRNLTPAREIFG